MPLKKTARSTPSRKSSLMLCLIALFFLLMAPIVYGYWTDLLQLTVLWQRHLNQALSALLTDIADNSTQAGFILVGVSFLYGLLHAVGPGHGKVIIATYIATHPKDLKRSVVLTLLASLLQGGGAIIIATLVLSILNLSVHYIHLTGLYLEKLSYLLIIMLGFLFVLSALKKLLPRLFTQKNKQYRIRSVQTLREHHGHKGCSCHKHTLTQDELNEGWRTQLMVVIAMGIRPCSGALLILIFSYLIDVYRWGILATISMSLGTALTISAIAVFVYHMKEAAIRVSQSKGEKLTAHVVAVLKFVVGVLFILMGTILFQSLDIMQHTGGSPILK